MHMQFSLVFMSNATKPAPVFECWSCGADANEGGEYCDDCDTCPRCFGEGYCEVSGAPYSLVDTIRCDCAEAKAQERARKRKFRALRAGFAGLIEEIKTWKVAS